jgi:hypothetical protein
MIARNGARVNWATWDGCEAQATSKWSEAKSEAPENVLDGTNATWWSSKASETELVVFDIDLLSTREIGKPTLRCS